MTAQERKELASELLLELALLETSLSPEEIYLKIEEILAD